MSRPARAKPTLSLRCSIEVEPSWLRTTSSIAWREQVVVVAAAAAAGAAAAGRRSDSSSATPST